MADLRAIRTDIIERTYREVLPGKFRSTEATVSLLAIGAQESLFEHRYQSGGPAVGFWQFELAGISGVLGHSATARYASAACAIRGVAAVKQDVYGRLPDDDLLACAFARLNLWWNPLPLPPVGDADAAFDYYLFTWRPGAYTRGSTVQRAHLRSKWAKHYAAAMEAMA